MKKQTKLSKASFKISYFPIINMFGGVLRPDEIILLVKDGCILTQENQLNWIFEMKEQGDCSPQWVYFQKLSDKVIDYLKSFGHCYE